jgi:hypothetical protein
MQGNSWFHALWAQLYLWETLKLRLKIEKTEKKKTKKCDAPKNLRKIEKKKNRKIHNRFFALQHVNSRPCFQPSLITIYRYKYYNEPCKVLTIFILCG